MPQSSTLNIPALQAQFEHDYPQDILRWASHTFGDQLAIVTSFQPTGIVTLHMLSQIAPHTPVLTLDTGLLFPESYTLMDELETRLKLNLKRVRSTLTLPQQNAEYGEALWERDPDLCCHLRKVVPLGQALEGYAAWITGLRRDQSKSRSNTPILACDERYHRLKLSPLATWTERMVWDYLYAYDLPYNPLHDKGYPSIGCWTCTQAVNHADGYSRSGRWSQSEKTECGIHLSQPLSK